MKVLQTTIGGKTLKTEFVFEDPCNQWVEEVLKCLRGKTVVDVPDPTRRWSPPWDASEVDPDNSEALHNRLREWQAPADWEKREIDWGVMEIPILDSLPAVCRRAAFGNPEDLVGKGRRGCYQSHNNPILYALDVGTPPAPGAFAGEITISGALAEARKGFCYALAHEIQHAINKLPAVYPALIDWEGYKQNVVEVNSLGPDDFSPAYVSDKALDRNIERTEELEILENTFGPAVRAWYKGYELFCDKMNCT